MNYKKPAFWIIVAAAISCIAVAICFLTNPISNTLNHIEGNNFNAVTQENTTVLVSNGETRTYAGAVERKKNAGTVQYTNLSKRNISKPQRRQG